MTKLPAPSALAALRQATERWPNRSRASDGIVPSAAHTAANPTSDHEPGKAGYCHAYDLTHDPDHGCDCKVIAEKLRLARDQRVKYIIFDRRICSSQVEPWTWRPYGGTNPHDKHMHVSIIDTKAACLDVSAWPGIHRRSYEYPRWEASRMTALRKSRAGLFIRWIPAGGRMRQVGPASGSWLPVRLSLSLGLRRGYVSLNDIKKVG
jgi:hypothetical protein